jgi:hypothetical protein
MTQFVSSLREEHRLRVFENRMLRKLLTRGHPEGRSSMFL